MTTRCLSRFGHMIFICIFFLGCSSKEDSWEQIWIKVRKTDRLGGGYYYYYVAHNKNTGDHFAVFWLDARVKPRLKNGIVFYKQKPISYPNGKNTVFISSCCGKV